MAQAEIKIGHQGAGVDLPNEDMLRASKSRLFLVEAKAYLRSANTLRAAEPSQDQNPFGWENRNPIYFLLLHATELALKALSLARGLVPENVHDIVVLARATSVSSDRRIVRQAYRNLRSKREESVRNKWAGLDGDYSQAALSLELDEVRAAPIGMVKSFKTLGALGQSEMVKTEFGEKVDRWWHAARYPRFGVTSYPDFDACTLMCRAIIDLVEEETRN